MAGLTRSYVHGASDVPLIGQTLGEYFDGAVARFPDADALVARQQKVRLTYRQLQERVDAFAAGLLALGLAPADRVGIWSPNNAEWLITQFATAKAGLILVNINPSYRLAELEYALNKVACKALITATALKTSDYIGMLTFGFGAALAGLAGGVLVPIVGASPQLGVSYIAKAFITVIAGGPLPLLGTSAASALFGTIDGIVSYKSSTVVSEVAVLLIAIVLLRLLPLGITGRLRRGL